MTKSSEIRRYVVWFCFALGLIHIGPIDHFTTRRVESTEAWALEIDEDEWAAFSAEAYEEHADAFTALFNSYTYKLSKNGRSMVNGKFVKAA